MKPQMRFQTSKKASEQMPMCRYNEACTRNDCIYRHEGRGKKIVSAPSTTTQQQQVVCIPFILNKCSFGDQCRNRHVDEEEAARIRAKSASIKCRFGAGCMTEGCLYQHPTTSMTYKELLANDSSDSGLAFIPTKGVVPVITVSGGHARVTRGESPPSATTPPPALASRQEPPLVFPDSDSLRMRKEKDKQTLPATGRELEPMCAPRDLYIPDFARNPGVYHRLADPMARYEEVRKSAPSGVSGFIDLHFQTTEEAPAVLERAIEECSARGDVHVTEERRQGVWVITGAGNHSSSSTSTGSKPVVLLFDAIREYLLDPRLANPRKFRVIKDNLGVAGGFFVYL